MREINGIASFRLHGHVSVPDSAWRCPTDRCVIGGPFGDVLPVLLFGEKSMGSRRVI